MGLVAQEVQEIAKLVMAVPGPRRVLSFGHPDILATPEELLPILGKVVGTHNEAVRQDRNYLTDAGIVGSAKIVFEALWASLDVLDIRESFGVTDLVDLNTPVPTKYKNRYTVVVDPGTSEHIFNVAQALKTAAEAVVVGGYVYHMVPMAHWNHGYWNFSPVAFSQFYSEQNGFVVTRLEAQRNGQVFQVEASKKFKIDNNGFRLHLLCIAQKVCAVPEITFPNQGKWK